MITAKEATELLKVRIDELVESVDQQLEQHPNDIDSLVESAVKQGVEDCSASGSIHQSRDEVLRMYNLQLEPGKPVKEGLVFEVMSVVMGRVISELEENGFSICDNEATSEGYIIDFEWPRE